MIKKISYFSPLFALITLVLHLAPSQAIEYQSPRVLSLGGAGRATPFLHEAIYLNPSYASFAPIYSLSFGYNWFNNGRNYNASVQDSRTELFQAGIGFTRREQNAALNLGASRKLFADVAAGLGIKTIIDDNTNKMTFDGTFSTTYIALPWMYSAIIVDNVFEGPEKIARNLYRTIYLGTKFIPNDKVLVYVDPHYTPNYSGGRKAGYSAGAEISILADFYFRVGKFQDAEVVHANTRGNGFGFGFGYLGPKIHLDYALHRMISGHGGAEFTTSNSIEAIIFF